MRSYLFPPFNIKNEKKEEETTKKLPLWLSYTAIKETISHAIWVTTLRLKQPILFHKEDMMLSESESSLALYKKCADFKDRQTKTMVSLR